MRIYFFFFLSFLEGASVMAAELLGAKMMAPYFGSSLYVWASVLGITLGGLALGYFSGGWISQKKNNERYLYFVLIASSVFLILMPITAKEIMILTAGFSLANSILTSSFIFLFPPVFFMGMVSPMIVQCITSPLHPSSAGEGQRSGKTAGTVFAISTLGGILSTFFFGFYLIPEFGLTAPSMATGILLGTIPFIKLIMQKNFYSLVFLFAVFFSVHSFRSAAKNVNANMLYSSEGLLGQILVADYPVYEGNLKTKEFQRILFVNRSTQTIVTYRRDGTKELFEYVDIISARAVDSSIGYRPSSFGSRALLLGLGGGSVANKLIEKGFDVDAVELDERMVDCAKKYFDLDEKVNIVVDDARHFVTSPKSQVPANNTYNIIILDAFVGEVNPHHLFTTEFFEAIKPLLSESGQFFINGNGYWSGGAGKGMRSVCETLLASGFDVELIPAGETEDYRNLLFLAKRCSSGTGRLTSKAIAELDLSDAEILTDERPQLEILNAEANKKWREACMKYFLEGYYSGQDRLLFK